MFVRDDIAPSFARAEATARTTCAGARSKQNRFASQNSGGLQRHHDAVCCIADSANFVTFTVDGGKGFALPDGVDLNSCRTR